jgi:hypothetical protein
MITLQRWSDALHWLRKVLDYECKTIYNLHKS